MSRNPYLQLASLFVAQRTASPVRLGQVLSVCPVRVRVGGLDLETDDLIFLSHLLVTDPVTQETALTLAVGDSVLCLANPDEQIFFIVGKVVSV